MVKVILMIFSISMIANTFSQEADDCEVSDAANRVAGGIPKILCNPLPIMEQTALINSLITTYTARVEYCKSEIENAQEDQLTVIQAPALFALVADINSRLKTQIEGPTAFGSNWLIGPKRLHYDDYTFEEMRERQGIVNVGGGLVERFAKREGLKTLKILYTDLQECFATVENIMIRQNINVINAPRDAHPSAFRGSTIPNGDFIQNNFGVSSQ